jgi:hypothetical protein
MTTDTDAPRTTAPVMESDALTTEQIAAIRGRYDRWLTGDMPSEKYDPDGYAAWRQNRGLLLHDDYPRLLDSYAALRDRLARAEERGRELQKILPHMANLVAFVEPRGYGPCAHINESKRMWKEARDAYRAILPAAPTDGAAPPRRSAEGDVMGGRE